MEPRQFLQARSSAAAFGTGVAVRRLVFEQLEDRRAISTLLDGFSESLVAGGLARPTAFEIAPDGRILVAEQGGTLRVIENGTLLPTPFLNVAVNSSGERGLLGVAVDPAFASNHFVYVYYTTASSPIHNRVSRFTAEGDVVQAGSETVLLELDNLSTATNHNGGAIHFGTDGKLYIGVGENANPSNSQTLNNRLGKMLRINADGSIPQDNPFFATAAGQNRAIWALGLRNPFTFAVQPVTGRIFINDVGQNTSEEINDGLAGGNYGWPNTEGIANDPRYQNPLFAYSHGNSNTTGCAIAGGAFYNPAGVQFPAEYVGDYFFADYCSGWIRRYDAAGDSASQFATDVAPLPVDLRVDDAGGLYYLSRGTGATTGGVYKIAYSPGPTGHPWQNSIDPLNVDGQSGVFPLDVLLVINYINLHGAGPLPIPPPNPGGPPPYVDVNGDDLATPEDALTIINFINSRVAGT